MVVILILILQEICFSLRIGARSLYLSRGPTCTLTKNIHATKGHTERNFELFNFFLLFFFLHTAPHHSIIVTSSRLHTQETSNHGFQRLCSQQIPPGCKLLDPNETALELTRLCSCWRSLCLILIPRSLKLWYIAPHIIKTTILTWLAEIRNPASARVHHPHRLRKCHLSRRLRCFGVTHVQQVLRGIPRC